MESEAADLSVVRHLTGLWCDPTPDAQATPAIPILVYDSVASRISDRLGPPSSLTALIGAALTSLRVASAR